VSIVIPTRNRRLLLERSLASALSQEGVDVEVIVVDDASEDDTRPYLHGVHDRRVSLVPHDAAQGVSAARNAGLERARAPWVAFLDDDDLWAPDKLAVQLDALRSNPGSRWSCVAALDVDEELRVLEPQAVPARADGDVASRLLAVNVVPGGGSGVLAETALAREAGGFDEELRILADWDLWIRLALRSPLTAVDRPLLAYLRHDASMTAGVPGIGEELARVEAKYAAERDARGVELDWGAWLPYIALMQRRAGLRLAPAVLYARLARDTRNPLVLVRALGALVRPSGIEPLRRRGRRPVPPAWRQEAESWLAPIREGRPRL
jgi:glycosyltransferase involved in cell wall biosynthesis